LEENILIIFEPKFWQLLLCYFETTQFISKFPIVFPTIALPSNSNQNNQGKTISDSQFIQKTPFSLKLNKL